MRIISFATADSDWKSPRMGIVLHTNGRDTGDRLDCEKLFEPSERPPNPLDWFDMDGRWFQRAHDTAVRLERDAIALDQAREKGWLVPSGDAYWFAPVPRPGKIVCVGLNYRDHAEESGMELPERPLVFAKWPSSLIGPGEPIVLPAQAKEVDYEAELGVLIGTRASGVAAADALDHVAGYLCANEVSARDIQFADGQWTRGKSFDPIGPVGPVVPAAEVPDPQALGIRCLVNGEVMQDSTTAQMVFTVAEVIAFVSDGITLEPGDLILTGTPAGVGLGRKPPVYLADGDEVTVEIDGIGSLTNPVRRG